MNSSTSMVPEYAGAGVFTFIGNASLIAYYITSPITTSPSAGGRW
jgi:hypothetical protein